MRIFFKWLLRFVLILAIGVVLVWYYGPREPAGLSPQFGVNSLPVDLDNWLIERESRFDDITLGVEREIIWSDPVNKKRTEFALVYLHGFSATSKETRPFSDNLAKKLGANLYYSRLRGHGRSGEALAETSVQDWVNDTAEAIAIGQRLGERVILIGTSTGGALASLAASDPNFGDIAALVLISPNFRVRAAGASLLTIPFARQLVPLIVGEHREKKAVNPSHGHYWNLSYPTVALLPMAALVAAVSKLDYALIKTPTMFIFSDADQVVDASVTRKVASRWGGVTAIHIVKAQDGGDTHAHVIAGDIWSPGLTEPLVQTTYSWILQTFK